MRWQNPASRCMRAHPETPMKSLNHIWQAHLPRLERLHAITMIMNIMEPMTVDMADVMKTKMTEKVPDISVKTIELVLSKMLKDNKIKKIGTYKDARYMRND